MSTDVFLSACVEFENEFVVIELKSGLLYAGYLWQYPDDVSDERSDLAVSIILQAKGRVEKTTCQIDWFFVYPDLPDPNSIQSRELVILKSEILSLMPDDKIQTSKIWSQVKAVTPD